MNESDFFDDDLDRGLGGDNNNNSSSNNSINNKKKQSKSKFVNATSDLQLSSSSGIESSSGSGMSQLGSLSLGKNKSKVRLRCRYINRSISIFLWYRRLVYGYSYNRGNNISKYIVLVFQV